MLTRAVELASVGKRLRPAELGSGPPDVQAVPVMELAGEGEGRVGVPVAAKGRGEIIAVSG
jgi:hypothetical protein